MRSVVSAYTVIVLIGSSTCLKIVGIQVPTIADLRKPITLSCSYDNGLDTIYSFKWYKDDHEFYRFMPNHKPNTMTFPMNGADVKQTEKAKSECSKSRCSVILDNLTPMASGTYTCEISTEAPSFRTFMEARNMTVAALPLEDPELEGLRGAYDVGDNLDVKCRTSPSLPPARINLYLNNVEVDERNLSRAVLPAESDTFVTMVRLQTVLTKNHFHGGIVLKVKCLASLMTVPIAARTVTGTAALGHSQLLHNQKLEWSNSSDRKIPTMILLLFVISMWIAPIRWLNHNPS